MVAIFLAIVLCFTTLSESARILGVVPTPSYSHQVVFRPIWRELSRRGHEVVDITTDPENDPNLNITEIDISSAYEFWRERQIVKMINDYKYNIVKLLQMVIEFLIDMTRQELTNPGVQGLLRNESEHFDLVMVEYLLPTMFGFSERFNCPYIGITSMALPGAYHGMLGNPNHPVLYPDSMPFGFVAEMNFLWRLATVAYFVVTNAFSPFPGGFENPSTTKLLEEHFGVPLPSLGDVMRNVSMVFINEDPAFTLRPLGPGFILFGGGAQITPLKPLPKDLKEYLDGAENGFIYFSLGTNVKSDVFTPDKRKIVLDAFRELPYRVLWKFDVTDIPDVPENVKIVKWLPQQDILRHPKIKVFITQGGLQSTEEATFSHVPIVGIPYIGDQLGNVKKVVAKGGGVFLDKDLLTSESLKEAVLEVINNPKYKESITEIAELSRDQPMTGIEKAIWWTEYVIRHKGARHFRNPAMDLPLYQYYFLDVIAFTLVVLSVLAFVIYKLVLFIKRLAVRIFMSKWKKIKTQ